MTQSLELGLDTFGDVTVSASGELISQPQALRNVVEEAIARATGAQPRSAPMRVIIAW